MKTVVTLCLLFSLRGLSVAQNPVKPSPSESLPGVINFEWEVVQKKMNDESGVSETIKYYFTTDGSYAAIKPPQEKGEALSWMVYSKDGSTWMFDDKKKVITVMNMHKTVGEGGLMGKEIAEGIAKKPLRPDKEKSDFSLVKTGKTKALFSYTAEEYQMKGEDGNGIVSFWYAKVPFDPVKIYTMGAGRPADLSKINNDPHLKNSVFALPILNKNLLWVETSMGGQKAIETLGIEHKTTSISTAGYKVKVMKSLKDMMTEKEGE